MKTFIYTLVSPLHDPVSTERVANEFLDSIRSHCGSCEMVHCGSDFSTYGEGDLSLLYVMTGGTEGLFLKVLPQIRGHVYILTSGKSNSLAASMEILSYLRGVGRSGEIIHGRPEYIARRVEVLAQVERGLRRLQGARFGVIGEPSDWLIASVPDEEVLRSRLGVELVKIPIAELIGRLRNIPAEPMKGAEEVYLALKEIIAERGLQGITIRCFDLLDTIHNTGCLALAKLNAEGIPASCEGDIPALVTMAIGNALTGQCGFQANPSRIDPSSGECLFAHCTVPLNMVSSHTYDTHFESGIGVAIRGVLPEGNATLFKVAGDLGRSFIAPAQLLRNQAEEGLCRTQVVLRVGRGVECGAGAGPDSAEELAAGGAGAVGAGDVAGAVLSGRSGSGAGAGDSGIHCIAVESAAEYFLKRPVGNHHIIFCGDYSDIFQAFVERLFM